MPTYYRGITFRSRLEARWAIILDELGIDWEYEPEAIVIDQTYHFPDTYNPEIFSYLPDFWLPEYRAFMEVKGSLDDAEYWKIMRIVHQVVNEEAPARWAGMNKFLLAGELFTNNHLPALTNLWNHKGAIMASRRIPLKSQYDNYEYWFSRSFQVGDDISIEFLLEDWGEDWGNIENICHHLIHLESAGSSDLQMIHAANVARNARFDRGHHV